jgi:hypothetical protein
VFLVFRFNVTKAHAVIRNIYQQRYMFVSLFKTHKTVSFVKQGHPCPNYYLSVDVQSILYEYLYYRLDTVLNTEIQYIKKLNHLRKTTLH